MIGEGWCKTFVGRLVRDPVAPAADQDGSRS